MVRSLKWIVFTLWAALPAVVRGELDALEKRSGNATTEVVCQSTYTWMNNKNNQSPCLVAAVLSSICGTAAGWDLQVLGPGHQYAYPNSSTADYCACSWAVYNLLGACTVCQGSPYVENWSPYRAGCGSYTTNTPFPTNLITVPNNTLLPYWAATDPSKWSGGSFNLSEASSIYSQGKSDIDLSASSQSSSSTTNNGSNAGAIAGGTVGGLAALAGLVALFFYLRRRKRNKSRKLALLGPIPNAALHIIHGRSLSDTSQMTAKVTDPVGFSPEFRPTVSPPIMYTSNSTIASLPRSHTASTSVNPLPYDVSIITGPTFTPPPPLPPPPPPPPPPPSQQVILSPQVSGSSGGHPQSLENVIVPYTMTSSSQDLSTDRKRADGNLYPIFEQQNEYQSGESNNQHATSRRRMNPPTYVESVTSGEPSVIRPLTPSRSVDSKERGHGHQGSSDTTNSGMTNTHENDTESSPMPRRTERVRESALSRFSGITGVVSDFGPSSVIGVGSAAITSPTDSQAGTNLIGTVGSVVGDNNHIA